MTPCRTILSPGQPGRRAPERSRQMVDHGAELHRHRFDRRPDGRDRQGHGRQVLDQAHKTAVGERVISDEQGNKRYAEAGDRHVAHGLAVIGGDTPLHGQADDATLVIHELPELRRLDIEIADRGMLDQVEVAPDGTEVIIGTIRGVPLYDGDVEAASGIPPEVQRLKDQLAAADALLLVTPEYNNGMPGVFKNAIDWMTRPASDIPALFGGKPIAILGASPGGFGTILAQNDWLPVLRTLRTRPWLGGRMLVSRAGSLFDDKGNLTALYRRLRGTVSAACVGGFARSARTACLRCQPVTAVSSSRIRPFPRGPADGSAPPPPTPPRAARPC